MKGLFLGLIAVILSLSFKWPSEPAEVTKVFLQGEGRVFFPGIEFFPGSPTVNTPDAGELVFVYYHHGKMSETLPSDLGSFVVLEHTGENRSLTSGFQVDERLRFKNKVNEAQRVGEALESTSGPLKIFFMDNSSRFLNPMTSLPPFPDSRPPSIRDVIAVDDAGAEVSLLRQSSVRAGFYSVSLSLIDLYARSNGSDVSRGIREWGLTQDTQDAFLRKLDFCLWESAGPRLGDGKLASEILLPDNRYLVGRLFINVGVNNFTVSVNDAVGNEATKSLRVYGLRP